MSSSTVVNAPGGRPPLDAWGITEVRRFGSYVLLRKLAEGGMAEIFLAKHIGAEGFERDVVIKRMLEHLGSVPEFVAMFLDEARLAARLLHQNIVQILDLGVAEGRHYICMEYLPGEDLQAIIRRAHDLDSAVPVHIAASIMLAACDGLDFAHSFREGGRPLRIVHRDISPSNIFVTYQGGVKLLDFGIAKAESKVTSTVAGTVKGKWIYMSPEQARGEPLDGRSDVFSLGISLMELLTCRRIFQRDNELATLKAILTGPIPGVGLFRKDVPDAFEAIVAKALSRDRNRRYTSAGEMRGDLESFLAGSSSAPGPSQIAAYLRTLFGDERIEAKTSVPTLTALKERGIAVPPLEKSTKTSPDIRSETRAVLPPRSHWAQRMVGALGAVILLAVGAAAAVFWLKPSPDKKVADASVRVVEVDAGARVVEAWPDAGAAFEQTDAGAAPTADAGTRPEPACTRRIKLSEDVIQGVIARSSGRILKCSELHRADLSSLSASGGRATVSFGITIQGSGKVSRVRVLTEGFEASQLSGCILKQLKAMSFPCHVDQAVTIETPFQFSVAP